MKPIPDEPSEDEARAALELLESLLAEFPLVDDVAKRRCPIQSAVKKF
jgi:hypothetical protein